MSTACSSCMHLLAPSLCLSVTSTWARSSTRHTYAYLARNHLKLARSITEPRNGNIEQLQTSTSARVQNARRKPTLCDHDYSAQLHSQKSHRHPHTPPRLGRRRTGLRCIYPSERKAWTRNPHWNIPWTLSSMAESQCVYYSTTSLELGGG